MAEDREAIYQAIRNADAKGDSAAVRTLGNYLKTLDAPAQKPAEQVATEQRQRNVDEMSGLERFHAGAGKAFYDAGNGIKQLLDKPAVALESLMGDKIAASAAKFFGTPTAKASADATQKDIDERKVLAAPLMKTKGGFAGNVAGNVAIALPAAFVPGGATLAGSAATGAGLGFVQPVATDESRLTNTAIGAAAGPLGVLGGRAVAATWKGGKALVEPFTAKGREAIAGRTLERFGVEAGDVAGLTGQATTTGAERTLAEQVARPEGAAAAARLQDAVRALDPQIAAKFEAREMANNAARVGTLKEVAGEEGGREFAAMMRKNTSKELYDKAFDSAKIDYSQLTKGERGEVTKLMNMPAVKDAIKAAQQNALNEGKSLNKPEMSVEGLHMMQLAMKDMIDNAGSSAAQVNKAMSISMARDRLLNFIQRMSPEYAEARGTHAAMSKPLNQMDTAAEILKRGASATTDLAGNQRLMPNALANAMKDEGRLISQATGGKAPQTTLADMLEPNQLSKIKAVASEVDKVGAVARAGNGPGSATAQRMASQNVMRQMLGPTGLPESWAESTLLNTMARPVQFAYNGVAEPRIQQVITELLLDPSKAAAAMQAAKTAPHTLSPEIRAALPYLEQALRVSAPAAAVSGQR